MPKVCPRRGSVAGLVAIRSTTQMSRHLSENSSPKPFQSQALLRRWTRHMRPSSPSCRRWRRGLTRKSTPSANQSAFLSTNLMVMHVTARMTACILTNICYRRSNHLAIRRGHPDRELGWRPLEAALGHRQASSADRPIELSRDSLVENAPKQFRIL